MTELRDDAVGGMPLHEGDGVPQVPRWKAIQDEVRECEVVAFTVGNLLSTFPKIDRFELREHVGTGGMGAVFKAYDPKLRRIVAIKLCKFEDGEAATAIEHEARCLAQVAHPNVVAAYDVVRTGTDVLLVMEYVKGWTLRRWLIETDPSWPEVLNCFVDAGHGLEAVHAAGLEHGDFKLDNVLVGDDGRVRVVDFGIARHLAGMAGMAGMPDDEFDVRDLGTKLYMAPERLLGRPSDARADVFAFSVSLWEAVYGVRPYPGKTDQELLDSMESGTLATGRALPGTPEALRPILAAGISPRVDERPPSMTPLLRVLAELPEIEQRRIQQRRRATLVSGVLALVVVVVIQAIALRRVRVEHEPEPQSRSEPVIVAPVEVEPSMERAMSLAARGDAFGALGEFRRLDERVSVDIDPILRLACVLVDRARTLPSGAREKVLLVADQVANAAEFKAAWGGTAIQLQAAHSLSAEITALN